MEINVQSGHIALRSQSEYQKFIGQCVQRECDTCEVTAVYDRVQSHDSKRFNRLASPLLDQFVFQKLHEFFF